MDIFQNYLTINQLAKVCSISRASLLRMEQDGILTPAYVNPDNGYRYYDSGSVMRVSRNLSLQDLGITHRELKKYYESPHTYEDLLHKLQEKMAIMEYHIANLKLQLHEDEHLSTSHFFFPEMDCYTVKMFNVTDLTTVRPSIWTVFEEVVERGYCVDRRMHPFVLINFSKIEANHYKNIGYNYEICIPVIVNKPSDSIKHFAATDTLSSILYGGSKDIRIAFKKLSDEITNSNYTHADHARIIAVVNSYPGEEIPQEYWVTRVSIPISPKNK